MLLELGGVYRTDWIVLPRQRRGGRWAEHRTAAVLPAAYDRGGWAVWLGGVEEGAGRGSCLGFGRGALCPGEDERLGVIAG